MRNKSTNAEDSRSPEVQIAFTRPDGRSHITGAGGGQGVAERGPDNTSATFQPKSRTKARGRPKKPKENLSALQSFLIWFWLARRNDVWVKLAPTQPTE